MTLILLMLAVSGFKGQN